MTKDQRMQKGAGLGLLVVALFPIKYALVQSSWWFVLTVILAGLGIAILIKRSDRKAQENLDQTTPENRPTE